MRLKTIEEVNSEDIPDPGNLLGDGLMVPGGSSLWYGQAGIFKSFSIQYLLYALGRLDNFLGWEITQNVPSLYLQKEVPKKPFQKRSRALTAAFPSDLRTVIAYPEEEDITNFWLDSESAADELVQAIQEVNAGVVAVDPLNLVMVGSEINDIHVKEYFALVSHVRAETGVHFITVHHANKGYWTQEGQQVDRWYADVSGGKQLISYHDTIIRLSRQRDYPGVITLRVEKVRHGPDDIPIKWIQFNKERLILEVAEMSPDRMVLDVLADGPKLQSEVFSYMDERSGGRLSRSVKKQVVEALLATGVVQQELTGQTRRSKLLSLGGDHIRYE